MDPIYAKYNNSPTWRPLKQGQFEAGFPCYPTIWVIWTRDVVFQSVVSLHFKRLVKLDHLSKSGRKYKHIFETTTQFFFSPNKKSSDVGPADVANAMLSWRSSTDVPGYAGPTRTH